MLDRLDRLALDSFGFRIMDIGGLPFTAGSLVEQKDDWTGFSLIELVVLDSLGVLQHGVTVAQLGVGWFALIELADKFLEHLDSLLRFSVDEHGDVLAFHANIVGLKRDERGKRISTKHE